MPNNDTKNTKVYEIIRLDLNFPHTNGKIGEADLIEYILSSAPNQSADWAKEQIAKLVVKKQIK